MDINNIEVKNFLIDTQSEDENIYETSFVSDPATGFGFLKFNKEEVKTLEFKQVQAEGYQRMVSGVWFMPDTKYIRYDKENGIYTAEFKREALKEALLKYLKSDYANLIKVEHQGDYLEGFVSMEHWIYENEDSKSPIFGLTISDLGYNPEEIKVGTVFKTVYVKDEQFWNEQILSGKVKGFSIGGLFGIEEEKQAAKQYFNDAAVAAPAVEVAEVIEVEQVVMSADASVLDERVAEVEGDILSSAEQPQINPEQPTQQVQQSTPSTDDRIMELLNKFSQIESKLENYIKENSLLKEDIEKSKEEIALKNSIIENQKNHLKDSPIKPSPVKSIADSVIPNKQVRTKVVGGIEIPY